MNLACSAIAVIALVVALLLSGRDRRKMCLALADSRLRLDRAVQEAHAASGELEAFSYTVAHDLRAPLRAIDGFSRALIEDFADKLEPEAARFLGVVRRNSLRMGRLMDDLLAFSRLSRQPLDKRRVEPEAIVRRILADSGVKWSGRDRRDRSRRVAGVRSGSGAARTPLRQLDRQRDEVHGHRRPTAHRNRQRRRRWPHRLCRGRQRCRLRHGACRQIVRRVPAPPPRRGVRRNRCRLAMAQRIVHRHGGAIWAKAAPGAGASFFFTLGEPTG